LIKLIRQGLIDVNNDLKKEDNSVLQVPIEDIIPNRFQPRLAFDDASLKDLSNSIKEHGIIQPLVLRRVNDKYEIIAGERRYKAAKMAGLLSVPAIISNLDDNESAEVAIVENIQRKDLSAIEEAKSYQSLLDKGYMTQEMLARKMGLSQSAISNKLRLLTLDEAVQDAVVEGKISERHARTLLKVPTQEKQRELLNRIITERLTIKQLEDVIKAEFEKSTSSNPLAPEGVNVTPIVEEPKPEATPTSETSTPKFFTQAPEVAMSEVETPVTPSVTEEVQEVTTALNVIPDIVKVQENAQDITPPEMPESLDIEEMIKEVNPDSVFGTPEKIPNKFFNFLEDSAANMNATEEVVKYVPKEEKNEEIEMLDDFIIPEVSNEAKGEEINSVIEKVRGLNLNSDKVSVEEINLPTEYQITIKIKKDTTKK